MVSEGMGTEIELTEEVLEDILTGDCCRKSRMPWCVQFEDCDDCYADVTKRLIALSEVYVVTMVPYGNHNSTESEKIIGIYRTLEKARSVIESRAMEFRPVMAPVDDCVVRYGYAIDGGEVMSSVQFPQYVIRRYLI
jgi:hypothetical protein